MSRNLGSTVSDEPIYDEQDDINGKKEMEAALGAQRRHGRTYSGKFVCLLLVVAIILTALATTGVHLLCEMSTSGTPNAISCKRYDHSSMNALNLTKDEHYFLYE